jgi:DNA invertase Pin-like site-specific DNA recombinase
MGRLMLNVLLSFAQFEREVTGERIRDKIAASKRKGLWMGGPPPLGYDVKEFSRRDSLLSRKIQGIFAIPSIVPY